MEIIFSYSGKFWIYFIYIEQKEAPSEANGGDVKDNKMEDGGTTHPADSGDGDTKKRPAEEEEDLK